MNKRLIFLSLHFFISCKNYKDNKQLHTVSYNEFKAFVQQTNYITDAEKYGWSFVQLDVYNFIEVSNATWVKPNGKDTIINDNLPVTQVSYNDALAYCSWKGVQLPTYQEYWKFVKKDTRRIVYNNSSPISSVKEVNVLGNVWDITKPINSEKVRLAGGSLFCSPNTCHGISQKRELYIDKETANIHIGFSVLY